MNQESITELEDEHFCAYGKPNINISQKERESESLHDGTWPGPGDEGVIRVKKKVTL